MKQILFLLLLPCLCMAQYTGNANQKITLGEQTTADGLVYRGVTNDTALITPLSDTSAYIILDTVNNKFFNYNRTTNVWSVAGGGTAVTSVATGLGLSGGAITSTGTILVDTASASIISRQRATNTFLTPTGSAANLTSFPTLNQNTTGSAATLTTSRTIQTNLASTSAATFNGSANITPGVTGVLPVANGGTGSASQNFVDLTTVQTVAGVKTFSGSFQPMILQRNVASQGASVELPLRLLNGTSNFKSYAALRAVIIDSTTGSEDGSFQIHTTFNGEQNARFELRNNGFVGIDLLNIDSEPTQKLDVNGNARIRSVGGGTFANNLNITSDGTLTTATSDEKYKYNILPINYGLNTILQLKPVNFQWINGEENDLGFIAQDVAEIIPEAVSTNWNSDLLFRYTSIIPILTKAIQEQNNLIKALEQRILTLENK